MNNYKKKYKFYKVSATCGCCVPCISGQLHYDFNCKIITKGEIIDVFLENGFTIQQIQYCNIIETFIKNKIIMFIHHIKKCLCGHAYYIYNMNDFSLETNRYFIQTRELHYSRNEVLEHHIDNFLNNCCYNYKMIHENMWKENGIGYSLSEYFGHPNKIIKKYII